MGRVREEAVRRAGARAALPSAVHPPRRHLQPSAHRDGGTAEVTFRRKDYAHSGKKRKDDACGRRVIRRFLLHVLPKGLVRIRHYGWMANRCRGERAALVSRAARGRGDRLGGGRRTAHQPRRCPICGGAIEVVEMIVPRESHVDGRAEDVCRILHSRRPASWLGHAGQGARTLERVPRRSGTSLGYVQSAAVRIYFPRAGASPSAGSGRRAAGVSAFRLVRVPKPHPGNPYGLLPRPPQTQAAHFKRLYRK